MHTPITYLRVFLTSLLFSLSWHYYTSVYFLDFLGHILMGSAAIYLGMYLLERWGRANSQLPRRTRGQQLAFWNLAVFILLIFVSQLISFIQFQFTYKQYLIQQTVYVAALAIGLFCLWRLRRRPASSLIQIPILFSSALLSYEIYLTTTAPNPNQTTQLAPVLEGGFVSYGGGNGRLINTHYGLPQRRYLSPFVPGQQSFRPPTQADSQAASNMTLGRLSSLPSKALSSARSIHFRTYRRAPSTTPTRRAITCAFKSMQPVISILLISNRTASPFNQVTALKSAKS